MSFVLWIGINIVILIGMFLYFNTRINRTLRSSELVAKARKELEGILVELNRATERNIALVEDRIHQLRKSIEAVDKRISILKREGDRSIPPIYNFPVQKTQDVEPNEVWKKNTSKEVILDLYQKGISPSLIAAKVGTTIGEVELIISLQDRKDRET